MFSSSFYPWLCVTQPQGLKSRFLPECYFKKKIDLYAAGFDFQSINDNLQMG